MARPRGADGREFTAAQALRTPQFAAIALTYFACCAAHAGPIFHMVTYAIDHGITPMAATSVLGVAGLASLGGRVVCGLLADRIGVKRTLIAGLALQAVAASLYLFTRELSSFYALALAFGFAYGGVMPLYAILVREYFGARIMGTVFGAVAAASTLGMALGPWAGGWLYDAFGSYVWLYIGSFGIGLGAVAIAFTFRAPRTAAGRAAESGRGALNDRGGFHGSENRNAREAVRGEGPGATWAREAQRRGLEEGDRGGEVVGRRHRAPRGEGARGDRHIIKAVAAGQSPGNFTTGMLDEMNAQHAMELRELHEGGDDRAPQEGRGRRRPRWCAASPTISSRRAAPSSPASRR